MSRYFKWPTESGEAFASVPEDYDYPCILGHTPTCIVSIPLTDLSLVEIDEDEWEKSVEKWRGLFGS